MMGGGGARYFGLGWWVSRWFGLVLYLGFLGVDCAHSYGRFYANFEGDRVDLGGDHEF